MDLFSGVIKERLMGKYSPVGRELEAFVLGVCIQGQRQANASCVTQGGDGVEKASWPSAVSRSNRD